MKIAGPRQRRRLGALLLLCSLAAGADAACDSGLAERMHAKLHPRRALDHERAVCQPWRGVPGRSVVLLPMPTAASSAERAEWDLDVLVVQQADNGNTDRAVVVGRLFQGAALAEDGLRLVDIRVDAARYVLAPDARAFGVRIGWQGGSRTHPQSRETLTLFMPDGPRLAKVLDGLEMAAERGEWDASCAGRFEIERGSLSVLRSTSHGRADLQLRRTLSQTRSVAQGEDCVTREEPAVFASQTLRFDGQVYKAARGAGTD